MENMTGSGIFNMSGGFIGISVGKKDFAFLNSQILDSSSDYQGFTDEHAETKIIPKDLIVGQIKIEVDDPDFPRPKDPTPINKRHDTSRSNDEDSGDDKKHEAASTSRAARVVKGTRSREDDKAKSPKTTPNKKTKLKQIKAAVDDAESAEDKKLVTKRGRAASTRRAARVVQGSR